MYVHTQLQIKTYHACTYLPYTYRLSIIGVPWLSYRIQSTPPACRPHTLVTVGWSPLYPAGPTLGSITYCRVVNEFKDPSKVAGCS